MPFFCCVIKHGVAKRKAASGPQAARHPSSPTDAAHVRVAAPRDGRANHRELHGAVLQHGAHRDRLAGLGVQHHTEVLGTAATL